MPKPNRVTAMGDGYRPQIDAAALAGGALAGGDPVGGVLAGGGPIGGDPVGGVLADGELAGGAGRVQR